MCTQPDVAGSWPLTTFSVVVLPPPFGPSSATTLPFGTTRSTPCSTSMRPYAAFRPFSSRSGHALTAAVASRVASLDCPLPEVGVEHELVLLDLGGGADGEDGAEVEHVDPRAHLHHERHVVLDHEDGHALARELERAARRRRRTRRRRGPRRARRAAAPGVAAPAPGRARRGGPDRWAWRRRGRWRPSGCRRGRGSPRRRSAGRSSRATSPCGSPPTPARSRRRSATRTPRGAGRSGRCRAGPACAAAGPTAPRRRGSPGPTSSPAGR